MGRLRNSLCLLDGGPKTPDRKQSHFGARHLLTNMLPSFVLSQMVIRTSWTRLRSSDARTPRACKGLNPVESALPKNTPVTPVQSALPHSLDLKPFRIRTYRNRRGEGDLLTRRSIPAALQALDGNQAATPIQRRRSGRSSDWSPKPRGLSFLSPPAQQRALIGLYWCDFAGLRRKEGACI